MSWVSSLILSAGFVLAVLLVVSVQTVPAPKLRRRLRKQVVVTLKSGASFHGILYEVDSEIFVLKNANAFNVQDRGAVPVDGELVLLRADIDFFQLPRE